MDDDEGIPDVVLDEEENDHKSEEDNYEDEDEHEENLGYAAVFAQSSIPPREATQKKKRLKHDLVEPYEHAPRKWRGNEESEVSRLPIKLKDGSLKTITVKAMQSPKIITPSEEKHEEVSFEEKESCKIHSAQTKSKQRIELSKLDPLERLKMRDDFKVEIAVLSQKIIANPEEGLNYRKESSSPSDLQTLLNFGGDGCLFIRKYALLSLMEVFRNIIPGYRIRMPVAKGKALKLRKEVRLLQRFEKQLLDGYERYLRILSTNLKTSKSENQLIRICIRCICALIVSKPHFNSREKLIRIIVQNLNSSDKVVVKECLNCVQQLLLDDPDGEITLEIIIHIGNLVRSCCNGSLEENSINKEVIEATYKCKLEADLKDEERARKAKIAKKTRKRQRKKEDEVGLGLQEAEASIDPHLKHARQAESLRELFTMYLRILKKASKVQILPHVLQGMARYIHLINLDLVQSLSTILSQKLLKSSGLSPPSALQAIQTVLRAGHVARRELDLEETIYVQSLLSIISQLAYFEKRDETIPKLIETVDLLFFVKGHHQGQHAPSFVCELSVLSLHVRANSSIAIISCKFNTTKFTFIRLIEQKFEKQCSYLLDQDLEDAVESIVSSTGKIQNTELWPLALNQFHYHPHVAKYSKHALARHLFSHNESPFKLYQSYNSSTGGFNPPVETSPPIRQYKEKVHPSGTIFEEFDSLDTSGQSLIEYFKDIFRRKIALSQKKSV